MASTLLACAIGVLALGGPSALAGTFAFDGNRPFVTAGAPDAEVAVDIDCEGGTVNVTAPPNYEYETEIRLVHVEGRSYVTGGVIDEAVGNLSAPIRGNDTADNPEEVYVFVTNASADSNARPTAAADHAENPVAVARRVCDGVPESDAPDEPHEVNGTFVPAIEIDCDAGEVRFSGPQDAEFYFQTSQVVVGPGNASISGLAGDSEGYSGLPTAEVDANGTVFVVIKGERSRLSDSAITVYERCGPSLASTVTTSSSTRT